MPGGKEIGMDISSIIVLIGFVGTCFLAVCLWRATQGHFKPDHHFGLEAAAWYWHFVDVVWLFLFVCIYWWGMGNALPATH